MAGSVNKVTLLGHLGADPEIKAFANGGKIANLRVATSESWKDKQSGERKERTEWTSVSVQSEGLVGIAEKYLRKGSKVYIEGSLRTRKWQDQSGADRYATEVVLSPFNGTIVLLDRKDDSGGGDHGASRGQSRGGYDQSPEGGGTVGQQARTGGGYSGTRRDDLEDEEIPF